MGERNILRNEEEKKRAKNMTKEIRKKIRQKLKNGKNYVRECQQRYMKRSKVRKVKFA